MKPKERCVVGVFTILFLFISLFSISTPTYANTQNAADKLKENIVTTGDGLYTDPVEANRYVYRGSNPNNFIEFNDELWRIISVEPDGNLKIIRNESLGNIQYDPHSRWTSNSADYCYYTSDIATYHGCNIWGSASTMLDSTGNHINAMPRKYGDSTKYNLPSLEAYINTYLNDTYYASIGSDNKLINNHLFKAGIVTRASSQSLQQDIQQEQEYLWRGKIGLINITDYIRSSTNNECANVYTAYANEDAYSPCVDGNYLYNLHGGTKRGRTMTVSPGGRYTWGMWGSGGIYNFNATNSTALVVTFPVAFLTHNLRIASGAGTSSDPYKIRYSGESDVSLSIASSLALNLNTDSLTIEPTINGPTEKSTVIASVSTNDIIGYKLIMSSVEDNTDLKHTSMDGYSVQSTTNLLSSGNDLATNTWGYNIGDKDSVATFGKIPALSAPDMIKQTSGLVANDLTSVTFGAKVNMDIPAGNYLGAVQFTVLANI